jgi:hypothetical protein
VNRWEALLGNTPISDHPCSAGNAERVSVRPRRASALNTTDSSFPVSVSACPSSVIPPISPALVFDRFEEFPALALGVITIHVAPRVREGNNSSGRNSQSEVFRTLETCSIDLRTAAPPRLKRFKAHSALSALLNKLYPPVLRRRLHPNGQASSVRSTGRQNPSTIRAVLRPAHQSARSRAVWRTARTLSP